MTSLAVNIPTGYPLVGLTAVGATYLTLAQTLLVVKARRNAKVAYPQLYAENAEAAADPLKHKFNCVQRAHQNTLEDIPAFFVSLFVAGFKYPTFATGAGLVFILSRVLYTIGYSTGQPSRRAGGAIPSKLSLIALQIGAAVSAVKLVQATL